MHPSAPHLAPRARHLLRTLIARHIQDGEPVGSMRAVSRRLGPDAVGREVRFGLLRAGAPADLAMTIGERPRNED